MQLNVRSKMFKKWNEIFSNVTMIVSTRSTCTRLRTGTRCVHSLKILMKLPEWRNDWTTLEIWTAFCFYRTYLLGNCIIINSFKCSHQVLSTNLAFKDRGWRMVNVDKGGSKIVEELVASDFGRFEVTASWSSNRSGYSD